MKLSEQALVHLQIVLAQGRLPHRKKFTNTTILQPYFLCSLCYLVHISPLLFDKFEFEHQVYLLGCITCRPLTTPNNMCRKNKSEGNEAARCPQCTKDLGTKRSYNSSRKQKEPEHRGKEEADNFHTIVKRCLQENSTTKKNHNSTASYTASPPTFRPKYLYPNLSSLCFPCCFNFDIAYYNNLTPTVPNEPESTSDRILKQGLHQQRKVKIIELHL